MFRRCSDARRRVVAEHIRRARADWVPCYASARDFMKTNFLHKAFALVVFTTAAAASGCTLFKSRAITNAACPEVSASRDALGLNFSMDQRANAKVKTFVQAANDIGGVAAAVENEVAGACTRIGYD